MNNKSVLLLFINLIVLNIGILTFSQQEERPVVQVPVVQQYTPIRIPPKPIQANPSISTSMPSYLNYQKTVAQLKAWNSEAPELTEVGTYGKSAKGVDLYYIKVFDKNRMTDVLPKVLITACIHGNEPLSASTIMAYIGTILDKYGEDEQITKIVNSREIYFIPVVSPDSYPHSRHVNGVDPNRNFPGPRSPNKQSVPPIAALRDFYMKIKPQAVISGHTSGRMYLTPHGETRQLCPENSEFRRIVGKMGEMSRYRVIRACEIYGRPIYGTEVDYYYRNGSFAIVIEYGTHQRVPSMGDIKTEYDRTFKAVLHFLKEAPLVKIGRKIAA